MSGRERLEGARAGISIGKNSVKRPAGEWTPTVHSFLNYLHDSCGLNVPKPIELNKKGQYEILSLVDGESFDYPLPEVFLKDELLRSAARLLKRLHDASVLHFNQFSGEEKWLLNPVSPMEVICHGDFAPYNVAVNNSRVVGVFDFDTIHPGPRIADVAYAIYRFVPVMQSEVSRMRLSDNETLSKVQIFIDEYGIDVTMGEVLDAMVRRIERLIEFMKEQASNGSEHFSKNIEDGHILEYETDIKLIQRLKRLA